MLRDPSMLMPILTENVVFATVGPNFENSHAITYAISLTIAYLNIYSDSSLAVTT